ncbi:hypothetical protein HanRHA438_Chr10g0442111 [Helianthus annuus]|nr:hypothetical protein HanRHA438_Chr10g0442111 [Helianthus annuus]
MCKNLTHVDLSRNSLSGNKELCGIPLKRACTTSIVPVYALVYALNSKESNDEKGWQSIFCGMGVGAGSLIVISVLYILWWVPMMKHWLTSWVVSYVGFNLFLHSLSNGILQNRTPVTRHKEENRGFSL